MNELLKKGNFAFKLVSQMFISDYIQSKSISYIKDIKVFDNKIVIIDSEANLSILNFERKEKSYFKIDF